MRIDDVARTLGLSTRAVYRRIDALRGMLDPHLTRGQNNDLIFNGEALAILKRLEEVRRTERKPIRQAARKVVEELEGKARSATREGERNSELVAVLTRENNRLQEEVRWLRSRIEELTPLLALPRPRGLFRWLWPWRKVA